MEKSGVASQSKHQLRPGTHSDLERINMHSSTSPSFLWDKLVETKGTKERGSACSKAEESTVTDPHGISSNKPALTRHPQNPRGVSESTVLVSSRRKQAETRQTGREAGHTARQKEKGASSQPYLDCFHLLPLWDEPVNSQGKEHIPVKHEFWGVIPNLVLFLMDSQPGPDEEQRMKRAPESRGKAKRFTN